MKKYGSAATGTFNVGACRLDFNFLQEVRLR